MHKGSIWNDKTARCTVPDYFKTPESIEAQAILRLVSLGTMTVDAARTDPNTRTTKDGHYYKKCTNSGERMTETRTMFADVILVVLVVLSAFGSAESQIKAQLSPADLVKAVIRSELQPPDVSEIRWKYRLDKEVDGKQEIREVVETKSGSLDRLLATAGKPLTDAQQRDESERILRLSHSPEAQH